MGDVPERVLRGGFDWLGFGHADAPVWFVGREERLSTARCTRVTDVCQYFDLLRGFDRFEDFVETWEDVFGRPVDGGEGGLSTRWWASAFTLAYQGTRLTDLTTEERETRVREYTYDDPKIGRRDGDTVLGSVYPLPATDSCSIDPAEHGWDSVADYRRDVLPDRLDGFADAMTDSDGLEVIVSHAPREDFADPLIDRFDGEHVASWPAVQDGDAFDATRLHGECDGVLLVDAPPFRQGRVSYETLQLAAERTRELVRDEDRLVA